MRGFYPQPKSILSQIVEWLLVIAAIGFMLKIITCIFLTHWVIVLVIFFGSLAVLTLFLVRAWKNRNNW